MNKNVLNNISWSFIGDKFDNADEFRKELIECQIDSFIDSEIDEICFLAPSILISYWCYEGDNQIDKSVVIHANNGASLSSLEVLFKLHNLTVQDLDEIDHHFFQGLIPLEESEIDSPKFKVWQGS